MTRDQYLDALKTLGLGPHDSATAALLGLSVRQLFRIKAGKCRVTAPIAILLETYIAHGLRPDMETK